MITVEINERQTSLGYESRRLSEAIKTVLAGEQIQAADISLAVVDDPTIHALNRRYLEHDEPTDVLSFLLDTQPKLEGEIIVSADTACRVAREAGCNAQDELLLYVIHGALHLAGYDDRSQPERGRMRQREQHYLKLLGVDLPGPDDGPRFPVKGASTG